MPVILQIVKYKSPILFTSGFRSRKRAAHGNTESRMRRLLVAVSILGNTSAVSAYF